MARKKKMTGTLFPVTMTAPSGSTPAEEAVPVHAQPPEAVPISVHGRITMFDADTPSQVAPAPVLPAAALFTAPAPETPTFKPFTHVRTSIKGGIEAILSPCTAIIGPNRAMKTAVLDAIRLALTGGHPIGANGVDLMRLVPESCGTLSAELTGPSGHAVFEVEGSRARAKAPRWNLTGALGELSKGDLARVLPTEALGDLLSLGTAKAREAIFARFGKVHAIPELHGLSPSQEKMWSEAFDPWTESSARAGGNGAERHVADPVSELAQVATRLRSLKLGYSKTARAAEESADQMRASLGASPAPTSAEITAAETAISAAESTTRALKLLQRREEIRQAVESFKARVATLPPIPDEKPPVQDIADADQTLYHCEEDRELLGVLDRILAASRAAGCCAACGSSGPEVLNTIQTGVESVRQRVAGNRPAETQARAAQRASERGHQEARARVEAIYAQAQRERERLIAARAENEAAINVLGVNATEADGAGSDVTAARDRLKALQETGRCYEHIERKRAEARAAEQLADDAKKLEKEAGRLLSELLGSVKGEAETAVNKYMPDGYCARLVLDDGRDTCRWEVVGIDGQPHGRGAASGSEWCMLVIALGCAWSDGAPVRVLLLDDADTGALDPEAFDALLTRIAEVVDKGWLTQAILATWRTAPTVVQGWSGVMRLAPGTDAGTEALPSPTPPPRSQARSQP